MFGEIKNDGWTQMKKRGRDNFAIGLASGRRDPIVFTMPEAGLIFEDEVGRLVAEHYPALESFYRDLHANPELSRMEEKTSAKLAGELRAAGCEVTERFGGYGVVGLIKNGPGPTVLVRADMDALPIAEETGLPYASRVRATDWWGKEVPVMHACGHDLHTTVLLGTARLLARLKNRWSGTLLLIGQPAEEGVVGARVMLAAGLYEKFPNPITQLPSMTAPNFRPEPSGWSRDSRWRTSTAFTSPSGEWEGTGRFHI